MCYCRVFALSYFVSEDSFQVQASEGLYSEGQFDGGSFALRLLGGGLIFGIMQYMEGLINFLEFNGIIITHNIKGRAALQRKRQLWSLLKAT